MRPEYGSVWFLQSVKSLVRLEVKLQLEMSVCLLLDWKVLKECDGIEDERARKAY